MELETRSIKIRVHPNNIVEIINKTVDDPDSAETAHENVAMLTKAIGGKARAFLGSTRDTYVSREVMEIYQKADMGNVATALVTDSFGSKVMGNLFLKVGKMFSSSMKEVPTKLFSDRAEAEAWLLERIAEHQ